MTRRLLCLLLLIGALLPHGPTQAAATVSVNVTDAKGRPVDDAVSALIPIRGPRHHVYSFSPAKNFEIKLYVGTPAEPVIFDKPGVVVLGCNIHDHMVAWINVVDTPWFAKTAQGSAQIAAVPPGDYELQVWHPRAPTNRPPMRQRVTVAAGGPALSVQLPY